MNRTLPATLLVIGTILVAGLPPAEAKHGTSESKTYTVSDIVVLLNSCSSNSGIGGVRFCGVDSPAPSTVTVTVKGEFGLNGGGNVNFRDAGGATIGTGHAVCGTRVLSVPAGTAEVAVFVSRAWILPVWEGVGVCFAVGGDLGSVTLQWSAT